MFFLQQIVCSQTKAKYDRNSVSVILIAGNSVYDTKLKNQINKITISDKYYINTVSNKTLNVNHNETSILNELKSKKIPAQSLNTWRNLDLLIERARYNLTDNQVNQMKASARGLESVKDERWFKKLLGKNYIVAIKFSDIKTQAEIYDKQEAINSGLSVLQGGSGSAYIKRSREGYKGKATVYLYRIKMNDIDYSKFWSFWNNETSHLQYNYKTEFIAKSEIRVNGTQFKGESNTDLILKFLNDGIDAGLQQLGNIYNPFAAKTPIVSTHPVKAKIGLKEGVKTDQLFFVYELTETADGDLKYKRKGTLRAKNVADNRNIATGNSKTSAFYKVNWGRYEEGMLLVQKKDAGISISAGTIVKPANAYKFRISYNLSRIINTNKFTQFKIYGEGGISNNFTDENTVFANYANETGNNEYLDAGKLSTYFYGVGLEKDIFILPFIQFKPFFGAYIERSRYTDTDKIEKMSGNFDLPKKYGEIFYLQFGARLPINIFYNLKIVPSVSYSTRTYNKTTGIGSAIGFEAYPNNIVINDKVFAEIMLRFDF